MKMNVAGTLCEVRQRRWKRKPMLVLTDVSGAKQLSVLARRCCVLAPCRRTLKRLRSPLDKRSSTVVVKEEESEEDGQEEGEEREQQQEEEKDKAEVPQRNSKKRVNSSNDGPGSEPSADDPSVEGDVENWRSYTDSFSLNGTFDGESLQDCIDDETGFSRAGSRPYLAAAHAGSEHSVVVMGPAQSLTFRGRCHMTCLYGSVQVLGFVISQGQPAYSLYSLMTHNALSIEALAHCKPGRTKRDMKMEAKSILRDHVPAATRANLMKEVTSTCSIVLLERLHTPLTDFITSFPKYREIFTSDSKVMSCGKHPFLDCSPLTSLGVIPLFDDPGLILSEEWSNTIQELLKTCLEDDDGCPIILVCGNKNVGKSTFSRYLMNSFLNHVPCVEFLECDLGQTEFSPPGCVALHSVTGPLLSPPYMHQSEPRKMVYYGDVSCERDLDRYMEAVKYLHAACRKEVPLVINTMGWVKGLGLLVLIDLIRLLSPTHVVQFRTGDGSQELPFMTPEHVRTTAGWHTKGKHQIQQSCAAVNTWESSEEEEAPNEGLVLRGHRLLRVQAYSQARERSCSQKFPNHMLRELALLGSLSQLLPLDTGRAQQPLHSMLPYQVPFGAVALHVLHCDVSPAHILYTANASLVGLCQVPDNVCSQRGGPVILPHSPICDCFGIGILRGINMEKKLYYILTPVSPAKLRLVNCLLLGAVTIPHSLFQNQPGLSGDLPYLTSEYSFNLSGAGKIKVCNHLRRWEHLNTSFQ
eukprot:gi/632960185/ref/XP_007896050.1/ PREDICTED: polynucleotide 5'-hydroxyl-kinase NOL9 [Callorhinchus milii]